MALEDPLNRDSESDLNVFEQHLALYRSRVYERHFLGIMDDQLSNRSRTDKPTILVIEDNADDLFIIRWALLQKFSEVEVIWVSDASQVMTCLNACLQTEKKLPRVVLLDLYLPSAQLGLSVLKSLKSHPIYKHIPAVTLSRSADADDIAKAFDYASDSYIVKPSNYKDWLEDFTLLSTYWNRAEQL